MTAGITHSETSELNLDVELQATLDHQYNEQLSAGLGGEVGITRYRPFNLLNIDRGIISDQELSLNAEFLYRLVKYSNWQIYGEATAANDARLEDAVGNRSESGVFIESLSAQGELLGSSLQLIVGRHAIKDQRQWLFNSNIDGLSAIYQSRYGATLLTLGREGFFRRNLTGRRQPDSPNIGLVRHAWASSTNRQHSVYALGLDGRSIAGNEDLFYLGATSTGKVVGELRYRAQAAVVSGRANGDRVRGFGMDLGLLRQFTTSTWKPSLFGGFAIGTGGKQASPGDGFRQTGLQDNRTQFGGDDEIKAYGEAFDPELSNLIVFTVGASLRPREGLSLDLLFHRYQQHRASDELRDSALISSPTGISKSLGSEFDFVVRYEPSDLLSVRFVLGQFRPGGAFGIRNDNANFAQLILELTF